VKNERGPNSTRGGWAAHWLDAPSRHEVASPMLMADRAGTPSPMAPNILLHYPPRDLPHRLAPTFADPPSPTHLPPPDS